MSTKGQGQDMSAPEGQVLALRCARCNAEVDVCAFCERPDCAHLVCFRCLREDVGQSMSHPHDHGG